MTNTVSPYRYREGLKEGVPVGLGYFLVSFGFGITAVGEGLRVVEALLISMTNMTSAGQVAGVTVMMAAGTILEMILTQLVINARYSLMGISLTQKLDSHSTTPRRLLMSFGITDEIFALAVSKPYPIGPSYFYGLMTAPYLGWTGGTLFGALAGQILPEDLRLAFGIMIFSMFIAIILPPMREERGVLLTVLLAAGLSCTVAFVPALDFISEGFSIILCAILAAAVMAACKPIPEDAPEADPAEEQEGRADA
ncbi:MAG: AzlC family ABC transporter permease [Clostridia bacterium]|nr:AzlC family ABC transporter permease [Clostridia bacterium]MBQ5613196.1 AzlC family ABC transporter permease [Clostridia bacterium]MBQ5661626.1 AzlC family ABC transporter permease [Clostridia bacterium]